METKAKPNFLSIFSLVTYFVMVAVNALANALPINGQNTGAISDSYANLFAPAGITFVIWGVIYLLLALYTFYQIGLLRKRQEAVNTRLLDRVNLYFAVSSLANTAWIFAWHYNLIPVSMGLMLVVLLCLILINLAINKADLSQKERFFLRVPFGLYFGWISVATIANVTTLLVDIKWDRFGFSEALWTVVILVVGAIITGITTLRTRNIAYGLVPIWAYAGILLKHLGKDANSYNYAYPSVVWAVAICLVGLLLVLGYALFAPKKSQPEA